MTLKELIEFRNDNKITLLELAANTGLAQSYLEMIEGGAVQPLENDLKRIEKALLRIKDRAGSE